MASEELKPYQAFANLRHGHARHQGSGPTPTYNSWLAMRTRCTNVARDIAKKWVARGITMDPLWGSFEVFLADMGERPEGTSLDRINNNAGYSRSNCRWATPLQQARNRRNAKLTLETATDIAVRMLRGESARDLAKEFGTSDSLPREIFAGRSWRDALAAAKEITGND